MTRRGKEGMVGEERQEKKDKERKGVNQKDRLKDRKQLEEKPKK